MSEALAAIRAGRVACDAQIDQIADTLADMNSSPETILAQFTRCETDLDGLCHQLSSSTTTEEGDIVDDVKKTGETNILLLEIASTFRDLAEAAHQFLDDEDPVWAAMKAKAESLQARSQKLEENVMRLQDQVNQMLDQCTQAVAAAASSESASDG